MRTQQTIEPPRTTDGEQYDDIVAELELIGEDHPGPTGEVCRKAALWLRKLRPMFDLNSY